VVQHSQQLITNIVLPGTFQNMPPNPYMDILLLFLRQQRICQLPDGIVQEFIYIRLKFVIRYRQPLSRTGDC